MSHSNSASRLDLNLLGPPQALRDGKLITGFRSSKSQALLYFLAVTGSIQRRATLAALLWPEADERQAGASLRNVLSNLRDLVGDYLAVTRETVVLGGEALSSDVAQFDALLKRTGDADTDIIQMEAAVSLYRGDLLQGFHLPDSPEFEQWATIERERLREAVLNSLHALAEWHSGQGDYAAALQDLTRLLGIDGANETGHRQKMTALARMGQRSSALQQYEVCRRRLAEDLGAEPSPQTTAVYELIVSGALDQQAPAGGEGKSFVSAPPSLTGLSLPASRKGPVIDRRDMPERTAFFGREEDVARLDRWLTGPEAQLITICGLGGMGKTTLAVEAVARLRSGSFERVVWRTLVNAPPLDTVLNQWLQILSGQQLDGLPESVDEKLALLFELLQAQRCLLILDNVESITVPGDGAGRFRAGYEDYGRLVDLMARSRHDGCLLLTTRELPAGLRTLEEDTPRVRILALEGLPAGPAVQLLRGRGVKAVDSALETLAERYSGNPLALKLVADTVRDLFGSDVDAFLGDETPVFDDIRSVLDQQYGRLSDLGHEVLSWLAIERKPVTAQTVWHNLARQPNRAEFLQVIRALQNNSLVDVSLGPSPDDGARLVLQNVVTEYLTDSFVRTLTDEIENGRMLSLDRFALVKAQSEEYVKVSQRRLLLAPVARALTNARGRPGTVEHLRSLLGELRCQALGKPGYAAANILHLLLHLETDLRGWDFSGLAVWQLDARGASLAGVDLRGADLRGSRFSETFGLVRTIAFSPDGRYLAAGDGDGGVFIWRLTDYQPHLASKGHTQGVGSVAFSPDSHVLASGGFDGKLCLWKVASGEQLMCLSAHADTIGGVAFSPDGAYLASGGADGKIIIWDWRHGEICRSLRESASVDGLAFSADARRLICAKDDKLANVWDWRNAEILRTLSGHDDKIHAVSYSPDGAAAATGGEDSRICLWLLTDPDAPRTLGGHGGWVWSLAFSPDGRSLASASSDRTVRLWDVMTGRIRRTLLGHTSWVTAVAFSPDGGTVASGGYDQTIRFWEERTGLETRTLRGHQLRVDRVSFSPGGALLATTSLDGPVHVWQTRSGRHVNALTGHRGPIRALALSENSKVVAGGCDDHQVYLWDVESGRLKQILAGHADLVRHVGFTPDERHLLTGSHDHTLRLWDAATGRLLHTFPEANARIQAAVSFSAEGSVLAYGSEHSGVTLVEPDSGQVLEILPIDHEKPVCVAFGWEAQLLACGTERGAVWVWQVSQTTGRVRFNLLFRVQATTWPIWRIVFSRGGRHMGVCGGGGANRVLHLDRQEVAYSLPDAPGAFNLVFDRDGRRVATAGADKLIGIRDAATGQVLMTLRGHRAEVTSLDVDPAENVLASSSVDGAVRLWDMKSGACLAVLEPERLYSGMKIAGATRITEAQRATLIALGADDVTVPLDEA